VYIFIITISLRCILKLSSLEVFTLFMGNVSAPVDRLVTELAQCQIGNSRGHLLCSNTCCPNSSLVGASGCSVVWPVFLYWDPSAFILTVMKSSGLEDPGVMGRYSFWMQWPSADSEHCFYLSYLVGDSHSTLIVAENSINNMLKKLLWNIHF
jgi:hypothetical protein